MKTATVIRPFLRNEVEVLPGQTFECSDNEWQKWASLGFIQRYETKVEVPPETKKKPTPSGSSRAARPVRKKTRKNFKKSAKKQ